MEMSFFKKYELQKARKRWQWAYFTAYANAVFAAFYGFVITDDAGHRSIGFDPIYTPSFLVLGLVLASLAWGIHRRVSLICLSLFFVIVALNTVVVAGDPTTANETIGSAIVAVLLFRGILGVREIKKVMRESKQQRQSDQDGEQPATGSAGTT